MQERTTTRGTGRLESNEASSVGIRDTAKKREKIMTPTIIKMIMPLLFAVLNRTSIKPRNDNRLENTTSKKVQKAPATAASVEV